MSVKFGEIKFYSFKLGPYFIGDSYKNMRRDIIKVN